jgi:hypothetical protein
VIVPESAYESLGRRPEDSPQQVGDLERLCQIELPFATRDLISGSGLSRCEWNSFSTFPFSAVISTSFRYTNRLLA